MADEISLIERHSVLAGDYNAAGDSSAAIKNILKRLGVDSYLVRRIAICSYEAEMNVAIHSMGGEIVLCVRPDRIELDITDCGPGIPDVELAMQEGYSTAPEIARVMGFGAGMGLSNMKNCADHFEITSEVGKGTHVRMAFSLN